MVNRFTNIINEFDVKDKVFTISEVLVNLKKLELSYDEMNNYEKAEILAFMLTDNYSEKDGGWGIDYGPYAVWNTENGEQVEIPSISEVTGNIVEFWKARIEVVSSAILILRYSDLVIEFSKLGDSKRVNHQLYKNVIDNTVFIYENKLYKHELHVAKKLKRAFNLAKEVKDSDSINKVKDAIISFEEKVDDNLPGAWGYAFELFILQNKKLLTEEDKIKIIDLLELRVKRLMEATEINVGAIEKAVEQLATYYKSNNNKEAIKNILGKLEESYDKFIENKEPIQRHNCFEKLYLLYKEFGLTEKANNILTKIREEGKKVLANMQKISVSSTIQKKDIERYINTLINGELDECISRIVWNYIPIKEKVIEELYEESRKFPMQYIMGKQIFDNDGRVITKLGSLEDDLDAHIIYEISQTLNMSKVFMSEVFDRLIGKGELNSSEVINKLEKTTLITEANKSILKLGLEAYFEKNYIVSINILVPQIESMFRQLLELAGGNVLKVNRQGNYQLITFDQILREPILENIFGGDTMLYLRILYTDQRGWNIRNNVCHGLLSFEYFSRGIADRIIHTLLLLSLVKRS